MKKGNSDHFPEVTIMSNDFVQCRYDINQEMKIMLDGSQHYGYSYSYIEVKPEDMNEKAIIKSVLGNNYSGGKINAAEVAQTIMNDWMGSSQQ